MEGRDRPARPRHRRLPRVGRAVPRFLRARQRRPGDHLAADRLAAGQRPPLRDARLHPRAAPAHGLAGDHTPDDLDAVLAQFQRVLAGEIERYELDKRFIRADGGVLDAHLAVGCRRADDGSVRVFLATLQDIRGKGTSFPPCGRARSSCACWSRPRSTASGTGGSRRTRSTCRRAGRPSWDSRPRAGKQLRHLRVAPAPRGPRADHDAGGGLHHVA